MSGRLARRSNAQRFAALEERVRYLTVQRKGHTESKTFIVIGPVPAGISIPPLFVGIDNDGETPEWKRLTGLAATLQIGTATISWVRNGSPIGVSMDVFDPGSAPTVYNLDGDPHLDPIDLAHADTICPVVVDASADAQGLSAAAFVVTAVR